MPNADTYRILVLTSSSFTVSTCRVLPVVMYSVSNGVTQIPTGDMVSRQFCGNHPFLKLSVITPGKQPCPMVIAEIFRNGPYYHGTQCLPREFVWHRETQKTLPPTVLYIKCICVDLKSNFSLYVPAQITSYSWRKTEQSRFFPSLKLLFQNMLFRMYWNQSFFFTLIFYISNIFSMILLGQPDTHSLPSPELDVLLHSFIHSFIHSILVPRQNT